MKFRYLFNLPTPLWRQKPQVSPWDSRGLRGAELPRSLGSRTKNSSAFTLVETLTVVLILGVLASMLLSGVGGMRNEGLRAKSMSNLRQSAVAFQAYASENNGNFPTALSPPWMYQLYPYVSPTAPAMTAANANALLPQTPFISPGITPDFIANNTSYDATKKQNFCYGMNIDLPVLDNDQSTSANRGTNYFNPRLVARPSQTCLLMTGLSWSTGVGENVTTAAKVYKNIIQVAYVDGHVGSMNPTNVPMLQNHFAGTDANTFWYGSPQR